MEKIIKNGVDLTVGIKGLIDSNVLVNMTPHALNIIVDDDLTVTIEPSGVVPRVSTKIVKVADGIVTTKLGDVEGLPEVIPGKLLIVTLAKSAASNRDDLVGPDTSPTGAIRDDLGRIVGVRGITV